MTTFSHSVTDSATMLRRNLRHILRFPDVLIMSLGLPVILLLLFVGVFGSALGARLGGAAHGGDYIDYLVPGILIMSVGYGATTTALAVNKDMTEGIIEVPPERWTGGLPDSGDRLRGGLGGPRALVSHHRRRARQVIAHASRQRSRGAVRRHSGCATRGADVAGPGGGGLGARRAREQDESGARDERE